MGHWTIHFAGQGFLFYSSVKHHQISTEGRNPDAPQLVVFKQRDGRKSLGGINSGKGLSLKLRWVAIRGAGMRGGTGPQPHHFYKWEGFLLAVRESDGGGRGASREAEPRGRGSERATAVGGGVVRGQGHGSGAHGPSIFRQFPLLLILQYKASTRKTNI